jgi:hypothetical protein
MKESLMTEFERILKEGVVAYLEVLSQEMRKTIENLNQDRRSPS